VKAAAALDLLPAAELPAEFGWAAEAGQAGVALARVVAAIEDASGSVVTQPVREVVRQELAEWNGEPRGVSRSWVEAAVSGLGADRAAARLALLTALAPYQVTRTDVEEFRSVQSSDEALILLTSWASMTAARRVGSWLRQPLAS
jgi:hypothetical protein